MKRAGAEESGKGHYQGCDKTQSHTKHRDGLKGQFDQARHCSQARVQMVDQLQNLSSGTREGERPQTNQTIDKILRRQGRLEHRHHPSKDFLHHRGAALYNHLDV